MTPEAQAWQQAKEQYLLCVRLTICGQAIYAYRRLARLREGL
jgi:hypothetical protein